MHSKALWKFVLMKSAWNVKLPQRSHPGRLQYDNALLVVVAKQAHASGLSTSAPDLAHIVGQTTLPLLLPLVPQVVQARSDLIPSTDWDYCKKTSKDYHIYIWFEEYNGLVCIFNNGVKAGDI